MQDDLQIPSSLRPKLANLDTPVKVAMIRSSQVLTLPPPAATTTALPPSPTKSTRQLKEKEKDKKKDKSVRTPKTSHAPNPFMFNKGTPTKGLRKTRSSGSLGDSPRGIPYSQMPANNSAYNLNLGPEETAAMKFMFPSLEDSDPRSDSPPLLPPPTLAELQDGVSNPPSANGRGSGSSGHVRGSSFDSSSPRATLRLGGKSNESTMQSNVPGFLKIASRSTVYLEGSSSWMGTSNGSGSGTWNRTGSATGTGLSMGLGNRSRPRVGSGAKGQSILVKDRTVERERKDTEKSIQNKERDWTPDKFNAMLSQTKVTDFDTERLKKLRIMLRNETTT